MPSRTYDPIGSYFANLGRGPILLTAPHTCMLFRGGKVMAERERTHKREHWVSTIVLMIADAMEEIQ